MGGNKAKLWENICSHLKLYLEGELNQLDHISFRRQKRNIHGFNFLSQVKYYSR
jgi:hypothetical protein